MDSSANQIAASADGTARTPTDGAARRIRQFVANTFHVASANVVSQATIFLATPILARVYGVEDFGVYAMFSALLAVLSGLFTLKYELAIVLPKESEAARSITALTMWLSVLFSGSLLALLAARAVLTGGHPGWEFLFQPFATVLAAATSAFQQWSARASDYRAFSVSLVIGACVNVVTAVALGEMFHAPAMGLMLGFVVGQVSTVASSLLVMRPRLVPVSLRAVKQAGLEFKRFPIYVLPSSLFLTVSTSALPWLVAKLFTLADVGNYAVASRVLLAPSTLIGGAVAAAFRADLVARLHRGEPVFPFFRRIIFLTSTAALCVFSLAGVVAPTAFALVFGDSYRLAGELARYLALGAFAQFIVQPVQFTFIATGDIRGGVLLQSAGGAIPVAAFLLGAATGNLHAAAIAYSLSALMMAVVILIKASLILRSTDQMEKSKREVASAA